MISSIKFWFHPGTRLWALQTKGKVDLDWIQGTYLQENSPYMHYLCHCRPNPSLESEWSIFRSSRAVASNQCFNDFVTLYFETSCSIIFFLFCWVFSCLSPLSWALEYKLIFFFLLLRDHSLKILQCRKLGLPFAIIFFCIFLMYCTWVPSTFFYLNFVTYFHIFFLFGKFFKFFLVPYFVHHSFFPGIFLVFFSKKGDHHTKEFAITPLTFKTLVVSWFSSCNFILELRLLDALFSIRKLTNEIWNRILEHFLV